MDRTLDYVPRLVEANLNHLIRDAAPPQADVGVLWRRSRWWTGGPVLDQGREGACVGFGCTGEAMASPVRIYFDSSDTTQAELGNRIASQVYHRAKEIDEWEGVDYDGTSVRAGLLVGRERKWWGSFKWAKNVDDLRMGLEWGPVIIGVVWTERMYETDRGGLVEIGGQEVGGHCLLITGYSPDYGSHGPRFRWRNSWGREYGVAGNGYIRPVDLDQILFQAGNEAAVVLDRARG